MCDHWLLKESVAKLESNVNHFFSNKTLKGITFGFFLCVC